MGKGDSLGFLATHVMVAPVAMAMEHVLGVKAWQPFVAQALVSANIYHLIKQLT
jgi:hypothetical protein